MSEAETLLASAGMSAFVSVVVAILTVHQVTVRRARAERPDTARQEVRRAVQPLLHDLARHKYVGRREPKRNMQTAQMQDHAHVVVIQRAAADLPVGVFSTGWGRL